MPAGRLELLVQTVQLVVHPVHVGRERAELVAIVHVDVAGEIARRDRGQPRVDALDRPDHGPREDEPEQQGEDHRRHGDTDEQVALARVGARVLRDQGFGRDRRRAREVGGSLVQVGGESVRLVAERLLLFLGRTADRGLDDPSDDLLEALAPRADLTEYEPVLERRYEAEAVCVGLRPETDERVLHGLVDGDVALLATQWNDCGIDRVEVRTRVLVEEQADSSRVALELAVCERSFLKDTEPRSPFIRLAEDA